MRNWTIKKRVVVGFTTLLLLVAGLAGVSLWLLRAMDAEIQYMRASAVPGLAAMAELHGNVNAIQATVLEHILAKKPEDKRNIEEDISTQVAANSRLIDGYEKTLARPEDRQLFAQFKAGRDTHLAERMRLIELSRAGKTDEAIAYHNSEAMASFEACQAVLDKMVKGSIENGKGAVESAATLVRRATGITMVFSVLATVVGILFVVSIVTGLNRALSGIAGLLNDGANQVAAAAGEVAGASQSLANGSTQQAASIEETCSALEVLSSMTKKNTEGSQQANQLAKQARIAADKGADDMEEMSRAMKAIKISSDDIARIIKTIDEIAFQTNLLALNAAVEAARAGESGAGFAVVADEVRALAQRSAQAARETAEKIEGAIGKTSQGVDISDKVAQALNAIVEKVRKVDALAAEVANASREQNQSISQINAAVSEVDKVTQSNAANAEESAAAAEELNAQAEAMKASVAQLLRLVGGGNRPVPAAVQRNYQAAVPPAVVRRNGNHHSEPVLTVSSRDVADMPVRRNGDHRRNGNSNGEHQDEF